MEIENNTVCKITLHTVQDAGAGPDFKKVVLHPGERTGFSHLTKLYIMGSDKQ